MRIFAIALLVLDWVLREAECCPRAVELQGLRRSAKSVHEELRRTDLQVRVSDVHEILQEVTRCRHSREPWLKTIQGCLLLLPWTRWVMLH